MITKNPTPPNGCLYVVGTPLGNLDDFSQRAQQVLKDCSLILCEDTRTSQKLLSHFNIKTKTLSFHQHNEKMRIPAVIKQLHQHPIALICDAGIPTLSDCGALLVDACHQQGVAVKAIGGLSAITSAFSVSGLEGGFNFVGFLNPKTIEQWLDGWIQSTLINPTPLSQHTLLLESTHRIVKTLEKIKVALRKHIDDEAFHQHYKIVLVKELSKIYETTLKQSPKELINWLTQDAQRQKGEFVIILPQTPKPHSTPLENGVKNTIGLLLKEGLSVKTVAKLSYQIHQKLDSKKSLSANDCYKIALAVKRNLKS